MCNRCHRLTMILSVGFVSVVFLSPALQPAVAQTIWATSFNMELDEPAVIQSVQKFDMESESPEIIIESRRSMNDGFSTSLTLPSSTTSSSDAQSADFISMSFDVYDNTIFSISDRAGTAITRWDAESGTELSPLSLEESARSHTLGTYNRIEIDRAANGDLLLSSASVGREQRNIARYSSSGEHIIDYSHPKLMHIQGSAVATDDLVFAISRHNVSDLWEEKVLTFTADGSFVGEFEVPVGSPQDVVIADDQLVVIGATPDQSQPELGGLNVYELDGAGLPTFSHTVSFPDGVSPSATHLDGVEYLDGSFFVGQSRTSEIFEISQTGELQNTFAIQKLGDYGNPISQFIVAASPHSVPEPSGLITGLMAIAMCLGRYRKA